MENFLALRRGVLEHVESGRITSDEFAAFVYITAKADHRTGAWKGCGETLARAMHWCVRKGQYILSALAKKGYLGLARLKQHYGAYLIRVARYTTAQPAAPILQNDAAQCADPPITAHQGATLQEVKKQEEHPQERVVNLARTKAGRRYTEDAVERIVADVQRLEAIRRSSVEHYAGLRDDAGRLNRRAGAHDGAPGPQKAMGLPAAASGVA